MNATEETFPTPILIGSGSMGLSKTKSQAKPPQG